MKKILCAVVALLISLSAAGCSQNAAPKDDKISVVAAIFPQYDWVREILGQEQKNIQLTLLTDKGTDLHSFNPSAADIVKISECDLFLYVGGVSDKWADDVLKGAQNPDMQVINLLETLGDEVKYSDTEQVIIPDSENHHEHSHDEVDEHAWLSLKNAQTICNAIADSLCALDPEKEEIYRQNTADYINKLKALDERYKQAIQNSKRKTIMFGDRFPFLYLTGDYSITCYAAFQSCSAETEASFETVAFLSSQLDKLSLPCVLTAEGSDGRVAKTIIENSQNKNRAVLTMHSMQSVTANELKSGITYLSVMENNLETLKTALN